MKQFLLRYYCETCECEMKDLSNNRKFLKKTKIPPSLKQSDFFVGANILLLSRDLKITGYADPATRKLLEDVDERTVCVLSPALYDSMGEIVMLIENAGFKLVDLKSTSLVDVEDMEAAAALLQDVDINDLVRPEPLVAMSFRGANSIAGIQKLIKSSSFAGMGLTCSRNTEEATQFANFFLKHRTTTATFEECTCCVIKPHAITERLVGSIIDSVVSHGFVVSAIEMFRLERAAAAEFLEVYDGVVPEYKEMVDEMISGPVVAMEIRMNPNDTDREVVEAFRSHAGPWDVNMAKELSPKSIRGLFGRDKIRNAVHCTDLPKDGVIEVEYFFKILSGAHYIDGWK